MEKTPIADELVERVAGLYSGTSGAPTGDERIKWVVHHIAESIAQIEERLDDVDPNVEVPPKGLRRMDGWQKRRKILGLGND